MKKVAQVTNKVGGYTANPRNSNLELFRIIVMLLIIAHHYVVNSGLTWEENTIYAYPTSLRSAFLLCFGGFGKTGINCFVLITGYFMCKSEITVKKFCKLVFEVEFYKIAIWFAFYLTGYEEFSFMRVVKLLLPVNGVFTGFTSCYIIFYLFIPFLNILIRNMCEKQHIKLLILCSFMYILVGTIPEFGVGMNYVSWFTVLYFIGSYIRIYDKKIFSDTKFWGLSSLVLACLSSISIVARTRIGKQSYYFVDDSNKPLAVFLSISAFLFFRNLKVKNSRFINTLAASTFGVLQIHANSDAMRLWLWRDTLNNIGMFDSPYMILHAVGSVVAVFTICTVIDYFRIRFIERPFFIFWDEHLDKLKDKYLKFETKMCEILKIQT